MDWKACSGKKRHSCRTTPTSLPSKDVRAVLLPADYSSGMLGRLLEVGRLSGGDSSWSQPGPG
jgi:hypothetical protein